jgi:cytochrome c oxidase subunit 1
MSVVLFFYIIYDQLVNGLTNKDNAVTIVTFPDYIESNLVYISENSNRTSSLE